jgi:DUF4097 and DUF4098 domain-containing protein YvlB
MNATRILARWALVLAVAGAAAALSACDVIVTSMDAKGKAEDQWTRTYPITAGGQLEIVNGNGAIDVTASGTGQIEVVAERVARAMTDEDAKAVLKQVEIAEEVSAARVRLQTKAGTTGSGRGVEIKYHVKVPATAAVVLQNSNGTVTVNAVSGSVRMETTNGSVHGNGLSGAVEATTTNGSVKLEVTSVAAGGIRAETTNGGIELAIPASAKANVKASCVNGGISLGGLTLEGGETTRRRAEGRLNGGGPAIVAATVNGGIRLIGK